MAPNPPKRQAPQPKSSVIRWLLDSDPAIRWRVMRDLTDAPSEAVAAERTRVATEGMGARLLALQADELRLVSLVRPGIAGELHVLARLDQHLAEVENTFL
mgnify:CR=1 FL=1